MTAGDFTIRPYRADDLDALYTICLLTADSGQDGSLLYGTAPQSVGDLYAAPYALLEPELCLVAESVAGVQGYILGTSDTARFEDWLEAEWFPRLRRKYAWPAEAATAAERLIRRFHGPVAREPASLLAPYPAHLHIDLLPAAQGQGQGRALMNAWLALLRDRGVPGVHLGLGSRNVRARRFYERVGFELLEERGGPPPTSLLMGLNLNDWSGGK